MRRNDAKKWLKSAKGRKGSSASWLTRQLNDQYVMEAKRLGYRGRAAFKLIEIDEKLNFLRKGIKIVDLGAAPGGWCQVATEKGASVVAIDLLEMDEMPGVDFIQMDFMDDDAPARLKAMLSSDSHSQRADVVMSDMAPNTTGHKKTDHLRIMAVVESAYYFAKEILKKEDDLLKVAKGFMRLDLLIPNRTIREWTEALIFAVIVATFVRTYFFAPFQIPSGSMLPTIQIGDHIFASMYIPILLTIIFVFFQEKTLSVYQANTRILIVLMNFANSVLMPIFIPKIGALFIENRKSFFDRLKNSQIMKM